MTEIKILSIWGMPGAGKTYWGKKLAEELSIDFVDLDDVVEKQNGISIFDMVTEKGEAFFRMKENEALETQLNSIKPKILSLGGGTPCSEDNLKILKANTLSLWLNTGVESILSNLEKVVQSRPLIDSKIDLREQMESLLEKRKVYYKRADLIIEQPYSIQTLLKLLPNSFKRTVRR